MNEKPYESLADFADMDVEATAQAIEEDEGEPIPGLRDALLSVRRGKVGRVTTADQLLVKAARRKAGMTQADFASVIHTPVQTLRDWEQGRTDPPGGVACLLALIDRRPEIVEELMMI